MQHTELNSAAPVHGDDGGDADIFLTPRVLDQRAFDELSRSLRTLIDDATAAAKTLGQSVEDNRRQRNDVTQSTQQLQERLRLSARMLKAVQVQSVALSESAKIAAQSKSRLDNIETELTQRLTQFQQRIGGVVDEAHQRLDGAVDAALRKLDERAAGSERKLQTIEDQMAQLLPHAERLCQMVETAEVNIAALAHRSATNARKATEAADHAARQAQHCDEASTTLSEQLEKVDVAQSAAVQQLEKLDGFQKTIADAAALHQKWSSLLHQLEVVDDAVTAQASQPIERPANGGDSVAEIKTMPDAMQATVEQLQLAISRDMKRLSSAVCDIASRVDRLQSQQPQAHRPPVRPQPNSPSPRPVRHETQVTTLPAIRYGANHAPAAQIVAEAPTATNFPYAEGAD